MFFVIVAMFKSTDRRAKVNEAELVFVRNGQLAKPSVVRSLEFEAMLRGFLGFRDAAWLVFVEVASTNVLLSLGFKWSDDSIVFTRADKSTILYSHVVATFLAVAFLEGGTDDVTNGATSELESFALFVLDAFLSAVLAHVVLLPVQHLLPFMIGAVSSVGTSTPVPEGVVVRQLRRIGRWCCHHSRARRSGTGRRHGHDHDHNHGSGSTTSAKPPPSKRQIAHVHVAVDGRRRLKHFSSHTSSPTTTTTTTATAPKKPAQVVPVVAMPDELSTDHHHHHHQQQQQQQRRRRHHHRASSVWTLVLQEHDSVVARAEAGNAWAATRRNSAVTANEDAQPVAAHRRLKFLCCDVKLADPHQVWFR